MSFNHFQFYGNHWESATEQLEERIRQLRGAAQQDPDEDIPEAEIDDSERREAIARERQRRRLR